MQATISIKYMHSIIKSSAYGISFYIIVRISVLKSQSFTTYNKISQNNLQLPVGCSAFLISQ